MEKPDLERRPQWFQVDREVECWHRCTGSNTHGEISTFERINLNIYSLNNINKDSFKQSRNKTEQWTHRTIDYWLLIIDYWFLTIDYWLLIVA